MARTTGWILDADDRQRLLERFPPRYADVVAHHVTLWSYRFDKRTLHKPASFAVVGHADDGRGVETLVVAVDGVTDRPDGSIFHCTWSIDPASGQKARHSNDLLAEAGWDLVDPAVIFNAEPAWL